MVLFQFMHWPCTQEVVFQRLHVSGKRLRLEMYHTNDSEREGILCSLSVSLVWYIASIKHNMPSLSLLSLASLVFWSVTFFPLFWKHVIPLLAQPSILTDALSRDCLATLRGWRPSGRASEGWRETQVSERSKHRMYSFSEVRVFCMFHFARAPYLLYPFQDFSVWKYKNVGTQLCI